MSKTICDECGHEMEIGEWPFCQGNPDNHEKMPKFHPFIPYWDHGVDTKPVWISSLGDRWKYMKQNNLDYHAPGHGKPGCEI